MKYRKKKDTSQKKKKKKNTHVYRARCRRKSQKKKEIHTQAASVPGKNGRHPNRPLL